MKEKCFIFVEGDSNSDDGMNFFLVPARYEYYPDDEAVKLEEIEIEYSLSGELTKNDIRLRAIKTLQDKQNRAIADAEKSRIALQGKIDKLILLEYIPKSS